MPNRREFVKRVAGAAAGLVAAGCGGAGTGGAARRRVSLAGRDITTVDVHTHVVLEEVGPLLEGVEWGAMVTDRIGRPGCKAAPCWGESGPYVLNADRVRLMDEMGFDLQVLSINPYWYSADEAMARKLIPFQNERLAERCGQFSGRFMPMAGVALQYPDMAAQQLEEAVRNLNMRAVAIGSQVNEEDFASPRFDPFWAKVQELGVLVFIHPGGEWGRPRGERLQGYGNLTNTIGNPLETTVTMAKLIFEGTLDRFPGLKVCGAHGGGYLAHYVGRFDASCEWTPGCKPIKKKPSEYLKDQILSDSLTFDDHGLRNLVAQHGAKQIVLGTDFPAGWPTKGVDHVLETAGLSDADKEAILGGNLIKLLRIDT